MNNQVTPQQRHGGLAYEAPDVLMSRKEAARYLGVSETTLAIWKSTGRYGLKVYKIGRLAKYKKSDLDAFILSRSE